MPLDASINILLIDDDIVDVMDLRRMFKKNKIANPLHVAMSGFEALAMLREKKNGQNVISKPCIILLDLNMPKMNGIEFLQTLRADPELRSMLVFVLTSSNAEQDKVDAYNLNVAGYILKPIQLENFTQTISVINYYWALLEFPAVN
jgi:CheY-like chemotaxis protein